MTLTILYVPYIGQKLFSFFLGGERLKSYLILIVNSGGNGKKEYNVKIIPSSPGINP